MNGSEQKFYFNTKYNLHSTKYVNKKMYYILHKENMPVFRTGIKLSLL